MSTRVMLACFHANCMHASNLGICPISQSFDMTKKNIKLKTVFDAAAIYNDIVLIHYLNPGPKSQNELLEILVGFQKFSVVLVIDILEIIFK